MSKFWQEAERVRGGESLLKGRKYVSANSQCTVCCCWVYLGYLVTLHCLPAAGVWDMAMKLFFDRAGTASDSLELVGEEGGAKSLAA